jgi:hypothetical protein
MRRTALAALAVAALASSAAATIVLRVTPRELADAAHLVVEGRVDSIEVRWDADRTCINTYVTLSVDRAHKGSVSGSVVVTVPGGRVGEDEVRVEGTAEFARDEEVMVFLWRNARGEWIVVGEAQGKFRLKKDPRTGVRTASNSLKGLCLVLRGDPKGEAASAARRPDCLPCEDLVAHVRASVEAGRAPNPGRPPGSTAATPPAPTGTAPPAPAGSATTGTPPTGTATSGGRDPAPQGAAPAPPSTTDAPGGGAPPPPKDAPAPPAGSSGSTSGAEGQQAPPPPPPPEKK